MPRSKKVKTEVAAAANAIEPITGSIDYFPIRGRAEPIRLLLAATGNSWEDNGEFKKELAGSAQLPFGQLPVWNQTGHAPLCQMDAICRSIGRQTGWYGRSFEEDDRIEALGGVESLRSVYAKLVYNSGFDAQAFSEYEALHVKPEGVSSRNSGAHLGFMEAYLERSKSQWVAGGDKPSISDIALFDIVDLHLTLYKNPGFRWTCLVRFQS